MPFGALTAVMRRPSDVASLGRDAIWRLRTKPLPPPPPTWPADPEVQRRLTLTWPEDAQMVDGMRWAQPVMLGLSRLVAVQRESIEQPYPRIVLFRASWDGVDHDVALDYSDYFEVDEACAERCSAYFKMQHLAEGYGRDNVFPGGYVPGRQHIYRYLSRLRRIADTGRFDHDAYGRFSANLGPEIRGHAMTLLTEQNRFDYEGSLAVIPYTRSLREVARARVLVDLPGNGDLAHRLVDYLAVGGCIVRVEPRIILPVPLQSGVHLAHVARDLSDLVDTCASLLEDDALAGQRRRASRDYFDRYLHMDQLGGWYLDRLGGLLSGG